jgi:hypothetical protein
MVRLVREDSASPVGSWGPKLSSSPLIKTLKSHIQCTELVRSMSPGSNQLIVGPSKYERTKRIFFSSSEKHKGGLRSGDYRRPENCRVSMGLNH